MESLMDAVQDCYEAIVYAMHCNAYLGKYDKISKMSKKLAYSKKYLQDKG
jgi:hypothetical protein